MTRLLRQQYKLSTGVKYLLHLGVLVSLDKFFLSKTEAGAEERQRLSSCVLESVS